MGGKRTNLVRSFELSKRIQPVYVFLFALLSELFTLLSRCVGNPSQKLNIFSGYWLSWLSTSLQNYKFPRCKSDTFHQHLISLKSPFHCQNELFELSCRSLTSFTHPRILIGSHSHELSLGKDKGIKCTLPQTVGTVILGRDDVNTRLVLVHRVQNNL